MNAYYTEGNCYMFYVLIFSQGNLIKIRTFLVLWVPWRIFRIFCTGMGLRIEVILYLFSKMGYFYEFFSHYHIILKYQNSIKNHEEWHNSFSVFKGWHLFSALGCCAQCSFVMCLIWGRFPLYPIRKCLSLINETV